MLAIATVVVINSTLLQTYFLQASQEDAVILSLQAVPRGRKHEKKEKKNETQITSTYVSCPLGIEQACKDGRCAHLRFNSSGWQILGNVSSRIDYILTFLGGLSAYEQSLLPSSDSHVFIQTADDIGFSERNAAPHLLVHTVPESRVIGLYQTLFPNPYLLRDMDLPGFPTFFPEKPDAKAPFLSPFHERKALGYFVGKVRHSSQRLQLGLLGKGHKEALEVHLKPDPCCLEDSRLKLHANGLAQSDANVDHLTKAQYKYVISMNGACSSQWQLYRDFFLGSVIIRERGYQEYWTIDLEENKHFVAFSNVTEIPGLIAVLEANQTWAQSIAHAGTEFIRQKMRKESIVSFAIERIRQAACRLPAAL